MIWIVKEIHEAGKLIPWNEWWIKRTVKEAGKRIVEDSLKCIVLGSVPSSDSTSSL